MIKRLVTFAALLIMGGGVYASTCETEYLSFYENSREVSSMGDVVGTWEGRFRGHADCNHMEFIPIRLFNYPQSAKQLASDWFVVNDRGLVVDDGISVGSFQEGAEKILVLTDLDDSPTRYHTIRVLDDKTLLGTYVEENGQEEKRLGYYILYKQK